MAVEFKTQVAVNGSGDSNIKIRSMPYMYRAYIKRSLDSASMGRLQVYIPEIGHPSREDTWISVRYLSPFAGASNPYLQKPMSTDFKDTQTAYGFWMVPPTIETEGLVGCLCWVCLWGLFVAFVCGVCLWVQRGLTCRRRCGRSATRTALPPA